MINQDGKWVNSPAYDVVYNPGMNGEHTMDINRKGKNFVLDDVLNIAKQFSISKKDVLAMASDISDSLSSWSKEAHHHAIPKQQISDITKHINSQRKLLKPRLPTTENSPKSDMHRKEKVTYDKA